MAATGDSLGPHGVPRQQGRCRRPQPSVPISRDPKATTPICLVFYNPPLHLLLAGSPPSLSQSHLALLIFHLSGFPIPDSTLASLCSTPIKHTQHRWNKVPEPAWQMARQPSKRSYKSALQWLGRPGPHSRAVGTASQRTSPWPAPPGLPRVTGVQEGAGWQVGGQGPLTCLHLWRWLGPLRLPLVWGQSSTGALHASMCQAPCWSSPSHCL